MLKYKGNSIYPHPLALKLYLAYKEGATQWYLFEDIDVGDATYEELEQLEAAIAHCIAKANERKEMNGFYS